MVAFLLVKVPYFSCACLSSSRRCSQLQQFPCLVFAWLEASLLRCCWCCQMSWRSDCCTEALRLSYTIAVCACCVDVSNWAMKYHSLTAVLLAYKNYRQIQHLLGSRVVRTCLLTFLILCCSLARRSLVLHKVALARTVQTITCRRSRRYWMQNRLFAKHFTCYSRGSQPFSDHVPFQHSGWLACTPSAFHKISMYPFSISTDKHVPLKAFENNIHRYVTNIWK